MNSTINLTGEGEARDNAAIELAKEIFSLFSLAITSLKLFPPQHPTVIKFTDDLYAKLKEYFVDREELEVDVRENAFVMDGNIVHKEEHLSKSLPYLFHKDGTRKFALIKGMDKYELRELLDVIRTTALLPFEESDIVLAIWEKDLPHVRLYAPDEYLLAKIDIFTHHSFDFFIDKRNLFSGQIQLLMEDLKEIQSKKLALGLMEHEEAKDYDQLLIEMEQEKELIDSMLAKARSLPPEIEFHEMMFELLLLENRPERLASILRFLERHHRELIQDGKFLHAVHLLKQIYELRKEFAPTLPEKVAEIDKFLEEVRGARSMDLLRESIISQKFDSLSALFDYFKLLGEQSVSLATELLDETQETETRRTAINYLKEITKDKVELLAHQLRDNKPSIMKEIINILGQHPSKKALPYLAALSTYENKEIKLAAIESLGASSEPLAKRILLSFIEDKDEDIAVVAMERLRFSGEDFILERIAKMVKSRKFHQLAPKLRLAILTFLARSGTRNALELVRQAMEKPGLLNRKNRLVTRLCAVEALSRVQKKEAQELLKRGLKSSNKKIRKACQRALASPQDKEQN